MDGTLQVVLSLSLQRRVEGLVQEHLDRMQLSSGKINDNSGDPRVVDLIEDLNPDENPDSFLDRNHPREIGCWTLGNHFLHTQRKIGYSQLLLEIRFYFRADVLPRRFQSSMMSIVWLIIPSCVHGVVMCINDLDCFSSGAGAYALKILKARVIVISGETGCGKTTQLPQYVLESEIESGRGAFCSIICTQPRRISAMAVAERVSTERGEPLGDSDLLPRRRDLRLILMSATLNAELFSNYFGGAPTIHIPGFTYPVRSHFLEDVLEMTGYKLTSFNQIDDYGQENLVHLVNLHQDALSKSNFENYSSRACDSLSCWTPDSIGFNLIEAVLCYICRKERQGAVLVFMTGWDDISSLRDQIKAHPLLGDPNRVLLLTCHGSMATSEQKLIFERAPPNIRKIVLATNMEEASITINDVVFVVDCGKAKETTYDALNSTLCLLPSWISQASARQVR
ncbi:hypothetical protein IFM89_024512 [Coptis chinensis]|uniref:Helicase C-terminal domain-containing protein n=1 Tax=Coptis chinensis TaxID=261450 RepID=A0A835LGC2_9MAGN|nr:hypothetical protein IFM89_024512 [Coptis chinensis]